MCEYENKNERLCLCFICAHVCVDMYCIVCTSYAHIYREFKSLCLIVLRKKHVILQDIFSDSWSEDGKFVEAIMKQTKMQTTTKLGLSLVVFLWLYGFISLNYQPAAHSHTHTEKVWDLQFLRSVESCLWVNADH